MSWAPKLFGLLFFFFFFCFKGCISTNLSHASNGKEAYPKGGKDGNTTNIVCDLHYHPVGDYCLLIDNIVQGTWSEMRDICKTIGGDLVNLQDANILYAISQYIKLNGIDDVSYWVGATDEAEEGKWMWSSDGSTVRSGVPLWGQLFGFQPDGGKDQNCGVLYDRDYFYMHDESCNDAMFGVICQPDAAEEIKPKGDRGINTKLNELTNDCPSSYDLVGNACLMLFPEYNYTWTEANDLCDGPNRHLLKIDDANFFGDLYDYLTEKEMYYYLWIGGTDEASEDEWVWYDTTRMKMGTPFWSAYDGYQEPNGKTSENCSIFGGRKSYINDVACTSNYGAVCQYDM